MGRFCLITLIIIIIIIIALPDHSVHRCGASLVSVLRAEVAVREEVHDCVESLRRQELVYSSLERVG